MGYDGSECSERALTFGLNLADKFSASVLILNVLELPVVGTPEDPVAFSAVMTSVVKDMRASHKLMLSKALEKATRLKPMLAVSSALREGIAATQIVDAAAEGGFEVVVLGHGNEGSLRRMLLGETSERVAHMAGCAVLIVK